MNVPSCRQRTPSNPSGGRFQPPTTVANPASTTSGTLTTALWKGPGQLGRDVTSAGRGAVTLSARRRENDVGGSQVDSTPLAAVSQAAFELQPHRLGRRTSHVL